MKTKEFTNKKGDTGVSYHLVKGDKFEVVDFDKVGVTEREAMLPDPKNPKVKKRTAINSYYLKIKDLNEEQTVTISLTKTQADNLIKNEPLKGKKFECYEYENKHDKTKPNVGLKLVK